MGIVTGAITIAIITTEIATGWCIVGDTRVIITPPITDIVITRIGHIRGDTIARAASRSSSASRLLIGTSSVVG